MMIRLRTSKSASSSLPSLLLDDLGQADLNGALPLHQGLRAVHAQRQLLLLLLGRGTRQVPRRDPLPRQRQGARQAQ